MDYGAGQGWHSADFSVAGRGFRAVMILLNKQKEYTKINVHNALETIML